MHNNHLFLNAFIFITHFENSKQKALEKFNVNNKIETARDHVCAKKYSEIALRKALRNFYSI